MPLWKSVPPTLRSFQDSLDVVSDEVRSHAMIDWQSSSTEVLLNPALPPLEKKWLHRAQLPKLPNHVWLMSSGTTLSRKQIQLMALSKQALLISAQAVNQHIKITSSDKWLNTLPTFHVGGLAIYARSHLSSTKVIDESCSPWNPHNFCTKTVKNSITLTSLVPTQVYDLVRRKLQAPHSLRVAFVGGAPLSEELYERAKKLHWPLLPTYGMTETGSQVATASLDKIGTSPSPCLEILPHMEVRVSSSSQVKMPSRMPSAPCDSSHSSRSSKEVFSKEISSKGVLEIKSPSLFSTKIIISAKGVEVRHRSESWYRTCDLGQKSHNHLKLQARQGEVVKISGEFVNISRLNQILHEVILEKNLKGEWLALANPDPRLGFRVDLVTTQLHRIDEVALSFRQKVHGFEGFHGVYVVEKLPKGDLGKVKTLYLQKKLGFKHSL